MHKQMNYRLVRIEETLFFDELCTPAPTGVNQTFAFIQEGRSVEGRMTLSSTSSLVNWSISVISRISKLHETTGCYKSNTEKGRLRKTTRNDNRAMERITLVDRFETAAGISHKFLLT